MTNNDVLYGQTTIPVGIRSRLVDNNNGITMHILEAGFEEPGRPLILLMHGYPELAFSWRKNLLPLGRGRLPRGGAGSSRLRAQRRHRRDVRR